MRAGIVAGVAVLGWVAAAASPAGAVVAPGTTTFFFGGSCTDCSGTAAAELVLAGYTLGTEITSSNFVSFHYDGTDLLPGFTVTPGDVSYVEGAINAPLPAAESFYLSSSSYLFTTNTAGAWRVYLASELYDYGTAGSYALAPAAAAVPEPASLALVGMGLAGVAAVRRRGSGG